MGDWHIRPCVALGSDDHFCGPPKKQLGGNGTEHFLAKEVAVVRK